MLPKICPVLSYPAIMPGVEEGSPVPEVEVRGIKLREIELEEYLPFSFNPFFKAAPSISVPQGYTLTLDPAQKRGTKAPLSVASKGEGHIALTGDGYVFYYKLATENMKQLDKESFIFEAEVLSKTPGAYLQYWGFRDADSKKIQSTAHTGSGRWERLRLNFTVDGNASQFFLYPAIMPGVKEGSPTPVIEIKDVRIKFGDA